MLIFFSIPARFNWGQCARVCRVTATRQKKRSHTQVGFTVSKAFLRVYAHARTAKTHLLAKTSAAVVYPV